MFQNRSPEYDVNRERLKPNRVWEKEMVRLMAMGFFPAAVPNVKPVRPYERV